ncbi:MFS transporter [Polycladidibacter hongkongensis]|uniref:MFS transporter n=1 Tax=Polycladidibacter hongkongensis TaxID=1647556 RepID=UPI000834596B|nr:MFS transporter [Pseudovibrio hongkongensis]
MSRPTRFQDTAKRPWHTLMFIGGVALLNAIGAGLAIPVMPGLVAELSGRTIAEAAVLGGYIAALYAAMQFLFGAAFGALSDRFGRRPVLLVSLAVLVVDYLIMTFTNSLLVLFAGRLVAGAASATYAAAYAAVADISGSRSRAQRFGMVGACIGAGFVFGPVLGGFLGEIGLRLPFYVAAVLMALSLTYGAFYMPETLSQSRRRPFLVARANPIGALRQMAQIPSMGLFLTALFFFQLANHAYTAIWPYFTIEVYGWSSAQVGLSLAVVGLGFSSVKGGLIRYAVPRHGEARTALVGFVFAALALFGFAFASSGFVAALLLPVAVIGALVPPAINGLMSCFLPVNQQGALQGAVSSLFGLAMVLSTLLMTQSFTFVMETGLAPAGTPFFLAGVIMLVGLAVFLGAIWRNR